MSTIMGFVSFWLSLVDVQVTPYRVVEKPYYSKGIALIDINECQESTLKLVWNELKYKVAITKKLWTTFSNTVLTAKDQPGIREYSDKLGQKAF